MKCLMFLCALIVGNNTLFGQIYESNKVTFLEIGILNNDSGYMSTENYVWIHDTIYYELNINSGFYNKCLPVPSDEFLLQLEIENNVNELNEFLETITYHEFSDITSSKYNVYWKTITLNITMVYSDCYPIDDFLFSSIADIDKTIILVNFVPDESCKRNRMSKKLSKLISSFIREKSECFEQFFIDYPDKWEKCIE